MLKTSSKVTSTWEKVIEVSALNPNATHSQANDPTLFLLIRKLIIINSCFQVEACCELKLAITFLPKIIWMVTNTEPCIKASSYILYWSLHLKTYKHTYLPCLDFLPSKKTQYEQSENDGHVIISEKEKHKININQMWEILTVTKIPFKVLYLFL